MLKRFRSWLRRDDAVVAIEFALVAMPTFLLIMGIIEVSMYFASGSVLEGASVDAGRLIRTGQIQISTDPVTVFKTELCNRTGGLLNCDNIQYEVFHITDNTFASAASSQPQFDSDGNLIPHPFDAGKASDVILVRSYYKWHFLIPYMATLLTGDPDRDWASDMSTVVIETEPYCTSINGTC